MKIKELYYTSRDNELTFNFTVWTTDDDGGGPDIVYSVKLYLNKRGKFTDWVVRFHGRMAIAPDEIDKAIMDFIETNWKRIQYLVSTGKSGDALSPVPAKLKTVIVRWQAFYETTLVVDASLSEDEIRSGPAADIEIDVPGSEYQRDTWEVDSVTIIE